MTPMRSPLRRSGWHSLSNFLASGKRPSRSGFPRRVRLRLEGLEDRLLLSATPNAAINMINSSGQEADTVVNGGASFTTSFLGTNDVTIQQLLSPPSGDYLVQTGLNNPPASSSCNNPNYLSGFVGSPLPPSGQQELTGQDLQGTGDGSPGSLYPLEGGNGDKFRINFAIPIGPSSQIILTDVDLAETVTVTAFDGSTPVSLSTWTENAYTGGTGTVPPPAGSGGWATWSVTGTNNTTGTLASQQDVQLAGHPVNVLTPGPGQNVTELVFSEVGSGNVEYQVLSPGSSLTGVSGTGTFGGTATLARDPFERERDSPGWQACDVRADGSGYTDSRRFRCDRHERGGDPPRREPRRFPGRHFPRRRHGRLRRRRDRLAHDRLWQLDRQPRHSRRGHQHDEQQRTGGGHGAQRGRDLHHQLPRHQ